MGLLRKSTNVNDGYYHVDRVAALDTQYVILLGERANGKSYSVKELCVREAFKDQGMLIYLRRWKLELKEDDVTDYFYDVPVKEITAGEYDTIVSRRSRIYLIKYSEDGDITARKEIGRTAALTSAEHLKSTIKRGLYRNVIFEEINTLNGYITNEPRELQQLISSIFGRESGRVWMIGNTLSRYNPYFYEWQLTSVSKMNPGEISRYDFTTDQMEDGQPVIVKIAVEFCESTAAQRAGKMFFGKAAESINTGVWETREMAKLPEPFNNYKVRYQVYVDVKDMDFLIKVVEHKERKEERFVFICSGSGKKPDKVKRIISDKSSGDPMTSSKLVTITKGDVMIEDLYRRGKLVYATNLAGTDFEAMQKDYKVI